MKRKNLRAPFVLLVAATLPLWQCSPAIAADFGLPSNLDLSTTSKTAQLPSSVGSVVILQGGRPVTFAGGSAMTPAQAAAAAQVLNGGAQTLNIGGSGNAVGGRLVLPGQAALTNLNVPHNVTAIGNFTDASTMSVAGNITNAGNFYAVSTAAAQASALINAVNITNSSGGLLSSVLPAGGLPGFGDAIHNLSLSLFAQNLFLNMGTISSAANLSVAAGKIVNASGATMTANQAVNVSTPTMVNSGSVAAGTDLTITSPTNNLYINNTNGTLSAAQNINVNINGGYSDKLEILGGSLLSQNLNLNAGSGWVGVSAGEISGITNVWAGNAHVGSAGALTLGTINITDDPTFWSSNDLIITASILPTGEGINLLAQHDVVFNTIGGPVTVTAFDAGTGTGKNINIIAGANLTTTGAASGQDSNGFPPIAITGGTVKVTGASATGGSITHIGPFFLTLDATGTTGPGGNIVLAAYKGPTTGGDVVLLGSSVLTGSSGAAAGNVTVIGENSVLMNSINMNGVAGAPKLVIISAKPSGSLTANFDGTTSGAITAGALNAQGNVNLINGIAVDGGSATITAGATLFMAPGILLSANGRSDAPNGGTITLKGKDVQVSDLSAVGAQGLVNGGNGGTISVTGTNSVVDNGLTSWQVQGQSGVSGALIAPPGVAGAAGGIGGNGGTISVVGGSVSLFGTNMSANGFSGGDGGNGGTDAAAGVGGKGGAGGKITVSSTIGNATLRNVSATGGDGGQGGQGGTATVSGAAGFAGGAGGAAGSGGTVSVNAKTELSINDVDTYGGVGGPGGIGGDGAPGATVGGTGGKGGDGGKSASGGNVTLVAGSDLYVTGSFDLSGGRGGHGGGGRTGGSGISLTGGVGGQGGLAQNGAVGGLLSLSAGNNVILDSTGTLRVSGGAGGGGGIGGDGGVGVNIGGNGGNSGGNGSGANGGSITIKANGDILADDGVTLESHGANSGNSGTGGNGGASPTPGRKTGGWSGTAGSGGNGGTISLTAKGSIDDLNFSFTLNSDGGLGRDGRDGFDGTAMSPVPQAGQAGGNAGKAGTINLTAASMYLDGTSITAYGGDAGKGGKGGDAGTSTAPITGGAGGQGGKGGGAATITIKPPIS